MKVPIDVENEDMREEQGEEVVEQDEETVQQDEEVIQPDEEVVEEDGAWPEGELTPEEEEAMVEAAKRAGAEAAERDMAADTENVRAERDELQSSVEDLESQLEAAKKDAADANDRLLRVRADWENYRRRTAAERLVEKERAAEKVVTSLLPVLDDMERATAHAEATAEGDEKILQFVEGVDAVHAKMLDILGHAGVEMIDPVGEAFNPLEHQAVGREENTEAYDETVAQVYQKGYRLGGKVIRAAMVTVTYGGPKRPVEKSESDEA